MDDDKPNQEAFWLRDDAAGEAQFCSDRPEDSHPDLLVLYDYWRQKADSVHRLPKWSEFDLLDLGRLAPQIYVADVVETSADGMPSRFFYRYVGTEFQKILHVEMTGHHMDEFFDDSHLGEFCTVCAQMFRDQSAHIWHRHMEHSSISPSVISYYRLAVPLINDQGEPSQIVGLCVMDEVQTGLRNSS